MPGTVHEAKVVLLLLGAVVAVFIHARRSQLRRLPACGRFLAAYWILLGAWALAVLNELIPAADPFLKVLEHGAYAASAIVMALWCRQAFARPEVRQS